MNKQDALQILRDAAGDWADELSAYIIPASKQFGDSESADAQQKQHDDIETALTVLR